MLLLDFFGFVLFCFVVVVVVLGGGERAPPLPTLICMKSCYVMNMKCMRKLS